MNDATSEQDNKYKSYLKRAWLIYSLVILAVIVVLVLFVAGDNEERFFFSIMPAAAGYVFRPTERYMARLILKYTGVSPPAQEE